MPKFCKRCRKSFSPSNFYRTPKGRLYPRCKSCHKTYASHPGNNPDARVRLLFSSSVNSKTKGTEHKIGLDDIILPERCPYLGIAIDYDPPSVRKLRGRQPNGPSIDRIDPTKGYLPGNVQVISDLANRMKQNATLDQLLTFARNIIRLHG